MTHDAVPEKCDHYWCYPHGTIQGRKGSEVAIVRYCYHCGQRQVAFASRWQKATGDYALDNHYEGQKRSRRAS